MIPFPVVHVLGSCDSLLYAVLEDVDVHDRVAEGLQGFLVAYLRENVITGKIESCPWSGLVCEIILSH